MNERQHYWDNVKGILIILVVVAHFMPGGDVLGAIDNGIYLFHMPLFIFVSGLFHNNEKVRERVLSLTIIGVVYNAALILVDNVLLGKVQDFYLFRATKIPWFVFVLAMSTIITYLLRDCNKAMVLIVTTAIGCIACYDASLTENLSIDKLLCFYPFYYLGYVLDPHKLEQTLKTRTKVRLGGGALVVYILITVLGRKCKISVSKAVFLFGGTIPYPTMSVAWVGVKLIYYAAIIVVSLSLLCIVPSRKVFGLTTIGERTMQIYFWHIIVRSIIYAMGLQNYICINVVGHIIWIMISVAIAAILSLKIFSFPTSQIIKGVKKR